MKQYEGGRQRLNERQAEKEETQALLRTHCEQFHDHVRSFPILGRLRELKSFVSEREIDKILNAADLAEEHYLGEEEYDEINRACRMMVNQHELARRGRLIDVLPNEEEIPDFALMASAGRALNDTRPWDVRVEEVLEDEIGAQRDAFWEGEMHQGCTDPSDSQALLEGYSQYGMDFDWVEVARRGSEWDKSLSKTWRSGKHVGLMWIDSVTRRWGFDVLLGFEHINEELHVVSHELRPRNDNVGWNINVEFVPKRLGAGNVQDRCSTDGVEARYWDKTCKVMKRTLAWCGQLLFEPFILDSVTKDKNGWSVNVGGEMKRELRGMYSKGTCFWVFGLVTLETGERKEDAEDG